jgi:Tol biopolymer transport system component
MGVLAGRIRLAVLPAMLVLVFVSAVPASGAPRTVRATVDTGGGDSNGNSSTASSARELAVAFESLASDLVVGDGNGDRDVFVRDLAAGTTVRASVDIAGGDPNGASSDPSLSADGQFVAFSSSASDLVPGDGNGTDDIFVRDLVAGTTIRASVDVAGGDPNGSSFSPSISPDGGLVAFASSASDLVPGDGNGGSDVFLRELAAGITTRVSVDTGGGDPNGSSEAPAINATGRFVAFHSFASDLVSGDGNFATDVFVRDLVAGPTIRASVDTAGGDPDGSSLSPSISDTGRFVAFQSIASDLVPGDGNGATDVFVRDLRAGLTTRASVDTAGGDANSASQSASIDAAGRRVAFDSFASDLVVGDGNGATDVFIRNVATGTTIRASVDTAGGDPDGFSDSPSISPTGRFVSFQSGASDLVPGDGNRLIDIFARG